MVNGIVAGVLFLVWLWLGFRLHGRMRDESWKESFVGTWAVSLVLYGVAASQMVETCGNMGDLLLAWAWMSMGVTLLVLGICLAIFIVGFVVVFCWAALDLAAPEGVRKPHLRT